MQACQTRTHASISQHIHDRHDLISQSRYFNREINKLPDSLTPLSCSGSRWEGVNKKITERQTDSSVPHAVFWSASLWIVWTDSLCRLMQELSNVFGSSDGAAEELWQGISCQSCVRQSWEVRPFQLHKWHQNRISMRIWANGRLLKEGHDPALTNDLIKGFVLSFFNLSSFKSWQVHWNINLTQYSTTQS